MFKQREIKREQKEFSKTRLVKAFTKMQTTLSFERVARDALHPDWLSYDVRPSVHNNNQSELIMRNHHLHTECV